MEQVVEESKDVFCSTPASISFRQHDGSTPSKNNQDSPSHNVNAGDKDLVSF